MDSLLATSNVLLWIAVVVLFFLVLALTRQVGVLYERIAPAGALMLSQRLQVGEQAPSLELEDINSGSRIAVGDRNESGRSQLLFFLSPDCPVCKALLPIVKSVAETEQAWLDLVLATDYARKATDELIDEHDLTAFTFVNSELLGKTYGVGKLPYAVLIDENSIIKSMGLVNSREHFERLFIAREMDTASVQQYLQQKVRTG